MGTVPKYNQKIVWRDKIDTPNTHTWPQTHIHDHSLSLLSTDTSINSGGVILVLGYQTSPLSEIVQSCKCYPFE